MNSQIHIDMMLFKIVGILPEVTVAPMQVVTDVLVEMTDKKELFVGYMASMITGDQGTSSIKIILSYIQQASQRVFRCVSVYGFLMFCMLLL